jgi:hypothetical protein
MATKSNIGQSLTNDNVGIGVVPIDGTNALQVEGNATVNGNVGIGTTNPTKKLQIKGASAALKLTDTGITNINFNTLTAFASGQNKFSIGVGNETNLVSNIVIDGTNGNVGIGTTTPATKLHVFGDTPLRVEALSGNIKTGIEFVSAFISSLPFSGIYGYAGGPAIGNNAFGESVNGIRETNIFQTAGGSVKIGAVGAGNTSLYTSSLQRLTVLADGNVGIGTTTPTEKLHVIGNALISGSVTAASYITSSDENLKDIISTDGDVIKYKWKNKQDDLVHIGYSAQEKREFYPDAVHENAEGFLALNYIEILVDKIRSLEKSIELLQNK